MRLDKFLAEAGIGKRKDVRIYIKDGLVKVNDRLELIPAIEIDEDNDEIKYKDVKVYKGKKVYYMFNKPRGFITAKADKEHKTVFDLLEKNMKDVFHVGRLDKDTEGLLLLTNDGEFEHRIMYPEKHVDKKYFFWALGNLSEENKKALREGVYIGQEKVLTKPAKIEVVKTGIYNKLKEDIEDNIKCENENQEIVGGYLTISEGKKHQVKKMLKAVGCYVVYLKRVSIGNLDLDINLKPGCYRELEKTEIEDIFR